VVLIGVLFFSESLTASKVAGIILILISIYLLKI
jgi:multidrug transporter EmrE-like cation transporter